MEDADVAVHVEKNSAGQVMAREAYGIGVRVLVDGRLGFAFVTREEDVGDAIGQATEASRLSRKTGFAFASGGRVPKVARLWDRRVSELQAAEVVSMGASVVDAVTGQQRLTYGVPELANGIDIVVVQHNQNANLRPNEKMVRAVCLACHGLGFSLGALADPGLVASNFKGRPLRSVAGIEMAARRVAREAVLVDGVSAHPLDEADPPDELPLSPPSHVHEQADQQGGARPQRADQVRRCR